MGIPFFFGWLVRKYPDVLFKLEGQYTLMNMNIDNLCIDMNGILHPACQEVYEYGNGKREESILLSLVSTPLIQINDVDAFEKVIKKVESIMSAVQPRKRVILCIDGVAGMGKIRQQRQRRFNSVPTKLFDPNSISAGTLWMKKFCKYFTDYIQGKLWCRKKNMWSNVEVTFSSDLVPGEGEHKLISEIRKHHGETSCVHALDADLIMLLLSTHFKNQYILRDDQRTGCYNLLNIDKIREYIIQHLTQDEVKLREFENNVINDFVMTSFLIGNDFLPHSPSIEIVLGGMDVLFDTYNSVVKEFGFLTIDKGAGIKIKPGKLKEFLKLISAIEKGLLEKKIKENRHIPDKLIKKYTTTTIEGEVSLDFDGYCEAYYETKLKGVNREELCHDYIKGLQWVLLYYSEKIPSWRWYYPHYYAPFANDLIKHLDTIPAIIRFNTRDKPLTPLQQLLCILPPNSKALIPEELSELLTMITPSDLSFEVDYDGKFRDWEGVVLLPHIDLNKVLKLYNKYCTCEEVQDSIWILNR